MRQQPHPPDAGRDHKNTGRRRAAVAAGAVIASAAMGMTGLVPTAVAAVAASRPTATATTTTPRRPAPAAHQLSAQIRYTTGGIPHILAHNWPDLGFGYGYAFAQDNICTMANDYVTVEAQRSRYFGPKGDLHPARQRRRSSTTWTPTSSSSRSSTPASCSGSSGA